MTDDWRKKYRAIVASDVAMRDGLGWEFVTPDGCPVWAVFREDRRSFPVFSAVRGEVGLPERDVLMDMTTTAVADLLSAVGLADEVGWLTRNLAAGLLWAREIVTSWEGEEWPVESGPSDEPLRWSSEADGRMPFAWLRALTTDGSRVVGIYQDDGVFGLDFTEQHLHDLPSADKGFLRSRRGIPLACGEIRAAEVVYDTTVEGGSCAGLVTETLLNVGTGAVLLIAAEAYGADEWRLFDESVVVLPEPARVREMNWIPARQSWRSTESGIHC